MNVVLHAAGAANFGYALYYDLMFVHLPPHLKGKGSFDAMEAFPGKWKYLTIWNLVIQLVYHTLALLNDVAGTSELNPKRQSGLQKCRDFLFASWAFPAGVFVSVVFWSVFAVDRELMFPAMLDSIFPMWLNHAVHSGPILFVALEHLVVPLVYPKQLFGSVLLIAGIAIYLSWITWVNHVSGVWAYPVLQVLNNYQRAVFMGGCAVAILSFYFIGDTLNRYRWGIGESKSAAGKGKSAKGKRKTK